MDEFPAVFPYTGKMEKKEFWCVCCHCRGVGSQPELFNFHGNTLDRFTHCGQVTIRLPGGKKVASLLGTDKPCWQKESPTTGLKVYCSVECGLRGFWKEWCVGKLKGDSRCKS